MRRLKTLMTGLAATLLFAGAAEAQKKYSISGWAPPTHVMTREIHEAWAAAVAKATSGKITFEVFKSGALIPALSTMKGVADGVAQVGHIAAPYHPSEMPINNLIGDIGHAVGDPLVLASAWLDYAINDPAGYKEWKANGVLPINSVATPLNRYLCRSVIKTLDDLKGKKIRAPGGGWARVAEYLGAIPVGLPFTEIYTAMERGAVDCVLTDATNLAGGLILMELTKTVIMMQFQPGYNVSQLALNYPFWKSLTNDERRILLNESAIVMARAHVVFDKEELENIEKARAKGVQIVEPDDKLKAAYAKWVADGFGGVAQFGRDRLKIADPEAHIKSFNGYLAKWAGLLKPVDRKSDAAILAVLKAQIFDKLDVAKFGME